MKPIETITIPLKEYHRLCIIEAQSEQRDINGVDNWEGNGCMCYPRTANCCIFNTEEPLKYLGLL